MKKRIDLVTASYDFHRVSLSEIWLEKERQRKKFKEIDHLAASIARIGLLHPIVVTRDHQLIAGERRFRAVQKLKWDFIPVHYLDELTSIEAKLIELEENLKRVDLTWKESCLATFDYHELCLKSDEEWNQARTGESIGLSKSHVSKLIRVAKALMAKDPRVESAANIEAALNVVQRRQRRVVETQLSKISFVVGAVEEKPKENNIITDVFEGDFVKWVETYDGKKFNFVHCDFPYGVKYDKTGYSGSSTWEKYEDSPEIYFDLLHSLADNKDKIFYPSAHLMFWFSMNYYQETINILTKCGFLVNPFPLIWAKDRGVIPDALRGPRRVYETALLASLGDRQVIKSSPNVYYCQVKKDGHISTKPRSMLEHFFQLFVDDLTEMLDPTCGGGSALAAGKLLKARRLVGLDINKDHVETTKLAIEKAKLP